MSYYLLVCMFSFEPKQTQESQYNNCKCPLYLGCRFFLNNSTEHILERRPKHVLSLYDQLIPAGSLLLSAFVSLSLLPTQRVDLGASACPDSGLSQLEHIYSPATEPSMPGWLSRNTQSFIPHNLHPKTVLVFLISLSLPHGESLVFCLLVCLFSFLFCFVSFWFGVFWGQVFLLLFCFEV